MKGISSLLKRNSELYTHTSNVVELSTCFATYMGYSPREIETISKGTLLHDIGKLFVPEDILLKVERLTKEDFEIIKNHTSWGYQFLVKGYLPESEHINADESMSSLLMHHQFKDECAELSEEILSIVIQHHERIDGKGYPNGLQGDAIHPYAKLVSICDVYDAITSHRCYKPSMDSEHALKCIQEGAGTQFDEKIGKAFILFIREVWEKKKKIV